MLSEHCKRCFTQHVYQCDLIGSRPVSPAMRAGTLLRELTDSIGKRCNWLRDSSLGFLSWFPNPCVSEQKKNVFFLQKSKFSNILVSKLCTQRSSSKGELKRLHLNPPNPGHNTHCYHRQARQAFRSFSEPLLALKRNENYHDTKTSADGAKC